MERGVITAAIKNSKVVLFFVLALVLFGMYSYYIIPKQENPDMATPVAMITVTYPGASPEEVERSVTRKIEDALVGISGYDYCESYSRNSVSRVVLWLENDADVEKAWAKLRQKMDDIEGQLPEGCGKIEINTDLAETAGMIISLSGAGYSYEELADFAEEIKKELSKVKGVSRFDITGKQEKEVRVEIEAARLNQSRLSIEDVVKVLAAQNMEIPPGAIKNGDARIDVRMPGKYNTLEELENTIIDISGENGSVLRLKDIARVSLADEDSNYKIKHNGDKAVLLTGYFQENKNIVLIGKDVEKRLQELKERLPEALNIHEVLYQPRDVENAVTGFMQNLLMGVLFVALVVFWGMGWRNATVIALAIPLVILSTFAVMNVTGIKIHQISVAALIIALGMLVDNAIVISDSIQVRIDAGEDRLQACVEGTAGVAAPVLSSTLTTVAAFVPLLVLPGVAGDYIESIPQIVIIALSASFVTALLFTPVAAFLLFKTGVEGNRLFFFRKPFAVLLEQGMAKRKTMVALVAGALAVTFVLALSLPLVFFPKADKNIMYVTLTAEQAANLEKTESLVNQVEEIIKGEKEITSYTSAIGSGLPKFFMTIPHAIQSQDYAQVMMRVDLRRGKRFKTNTELADYLQGRFDREIAGGTATLKQLELAEPVEAPVQVLVTGNDYRLLRKGADELKAILNSIEGTSNVRDDASAEVYEYLVKVDNDTASHMGITRYDLQKELNMALKGKAASLFRKENADYNILVKSDIRSKEELENLAIKSPQTGRKALLKQVATIELASQLPTIKKYDRERTVKVLSDVKSGYSAVTVQEILEKQLDKLDLQDVRVVFKGEKEKIKYHFGNLGTASLFAALIIYIIMLIQFNSLTQPLIIMLTIPLSVIGSVAGLFIFRQTLSFMALLGMVSLFGVVVNNAIILLDYINGERRQGKDIAQACRDAVEKRFRPIIMTTVTTILGLTPLVFGRNELFVPMAVSLMSGLLISTLLTLVVIPSVYPIANRR